MSELNVQENADENSDVCGMGKWCLNPVTTNTPKRCNFHHFWCHNCCDKARTNGWDLEGRNTCVHCRKKEKEARRVALEKKRIAKQIETERARQAEELIRLEAIEKAEKAMADQKLMDAK